MKEPIYIDSNVFIFPIIYEDIPKAEKAKEILRDIEKRRITAYTSILTWDEVVWVVFKVLGKADSIEISKKLLKFPNLRFINVNDNIIIKAQYLREKYQLNPRDAVHCSSSITKRIKKIISDNKDFDVVKEIERIPIERFIY